MNDLISRQQAINAMFNLCDRLSEPCFRCENPHIDVIVAELEQLPSALGTNLAEVGTDCISRRAALDAIRVMQTYKLFAGDDMLLIDQAGAQTELMLLPSAQPEIVRCKDCKHWIPYDWMFSEVWQSQSINDYPEDEMGCKWCDMSMKANDFCSRVERREVTNGN